MCSSDLGESVKDYCTRFNSVYNSLPPHMKPPLGLALLKFPEGFYPNMTLQLRERDYETLEEMKKAAISAEVNLIKKRARLKLERRVTYKNEIMPSASSTDTKIDSLMRTMERMIEKINLNERAPPRDNQNKSRS